MNLNEIKEALNNATPDWHDNGNEIVSKQNLRMGIGGFLKDEDNHLAANAPEWIASLISQVEEMQKTLEWAARIIDSGMGAGILRYDPVQWFIDYHTFLKGVTNEQSN